MTEKEAIEVAKAVAAAEGWAWAEPAQCSFHAKWFGEGGTWEIFSNALALGAKVRVVVDDASGEVVEKGYVPR